MSRASVEALLRILRLHARVEPGTDADVARLERLRHLVPLLEAEGGVVWLHRRLHDAGLAAQHTLQATLRPVARQHLARALRVDAATARVLEVFAAHQVPVIAIKGPARRIAAGHYPYADARSTTDVDLLVEGGAAQGAWELLLREGYVPIAGGSHERAAHYHLPGLLGPEHVAVELHRSTSRHVSAEEAWARQSTGGDVVTWQHIACRVPSATELLWHAVTHSFVDESLGLRLRNFLDGAVIIASGRTIAWDTIRQRIAAGEVHHGDEGAVAPPARVHRWLATAAALAGTAIPDDFLRDGTIPLARLLTWKHVVLGSPIRGAARSRLLDEAVRVEAGLGFIPPYHTDRWPVRLRRRLAASAARAGYLGWRAGHPEAAVSR